MENNSITSLYSIKFTEYSDITDKIEKEYKLHKEASYKIEYLKKYMEVLKNTNLINLERKIEISYEEDGYANFERGEVILIDFFNIVTLEFMHDEAHNLNYVVIKFIFNKYEEISMKIFVNREKFEKNELESAKKLIYFSSIYPLIEELMANKISQAREFSSTMEGMLLFLRHKNY